MTKHNKNLDKNKLMEYILLQVITDEKTEMASIPTVYLDLLIKWACKHIKEDK